MYSDRDDYIGQETHRLFDSTSATLKVLGDARYLALRLDSPSTDEWYSLDVAAAPGEALAPGVYDGAQRAVFRGPGHPGFALDGSGRGCNEIVARFEVFDVAFDAAGALQRLWLVYEQHCEGVPSALFGELRYGEPPAPTVPSVVRWPVSDAGHADTAVPVLLRPPGAKAPSGVSIQGGGASQFHLAPGACEGAVGFGSGTACVRHASTTPGTHLAALRVARADGSADDIPLQAFAFGGTTKFAWQSDPGDFVARGGSGAYTPANSVLWLRGDANHLLVQVFQGGWFDGDFGAPLGDVLAPGSYPGATRWPFNAPTEPGLQVTNSNGCNRIAGEFEVAEVAFDAYGLPARFGASFVQHCEGAAPALRGEIDFRLGDSTPTAPWVRLGPIRSVPPRAAGTGAASAGGQAGAATIASLARLRVKPRAFRAAPAGPATVSRRYGTRVRFSLDAAANVRFVVKRLARRGCKGPKKCRPRRARKPFTRHANAGPNGFRFTGRLDGRRLRPGRYRLVATPVKGGRRGHAASARFRIVR